MEILDRKRAALTIVLLAFAVLLPVATLARNTGDFLSLEYKYVSSSINYGEVETYSFNVAADKENLSLVIGSLQVKGYPLWLDASNWSAGSQLELPQRLQATVEGISSWDGWQCWELMLRDETALYYHGDLGILIGSYWEVSGSALTRTISLQSENINDLQFPGRFLLNQNAILVSIILIELTFVIWLEQWKMDGFRRFSLRKKRLTEFIGFQL